ncbi:hypothetical protein AAG906_026399 [Vitis piasezkii]
MELDFEKYCSLGLSPRTVLPSNQRYSGIGKRNTKEKPAHRSNLLSIEEDFAEISFALSLVKISAVEDEARVRPHFGRKSIEEYKGPHEVDGIVEYLKKQSGPASTAIQSAKDASSLIIDNKIVILECSQSFLERNLRTSRL